jgi:PAS domain S-box-containing protein
VALDCEGQIRFWNPGSTRIFGFGAEEAIGQSLVFIIPENLRAGHWEGFRRVLKTGQSRYEANELLSVPALTKSGIRISVEFTIVMMRNCGTVVGMAAIMRDVTRRFEEVNAMDCRDRSRNPASSRKSIEN